MTKDGVKLKFPQAVVFDKDGTLLKFDAFWLPVANNATGIILKEYSAPASLTAQILLDAGVTELGTDVTGVLCGGTYGDYANIIAKAFDAAGIKYDIKVLKNQTATAFFNSMSCGKILPICPDLRERLLELKERGIKLFVFTNDNKNATTVCLQTLNIIDLFDEIIVDEGLVPPKPNRAGMDDLIEKYGFERDRVFMVGDSTTDMKFASNAGVIGVGVGENDYNREIISPLATVVIENLSKILRTVDDEI